MSKSSKAPSSQKANEIKDLLLDVIQQEDASMSETEIFRLSQPYKKGDPAVFKSPQAKTPQADLPAKSERDPDLELNFEDQDTPRPNKKKDLEDLDEDSNLMKLDFDLHSEESDGKPVEPLRLESIGKPISSPPPILNFPEKLNPTFQADKTVKLNSPIHPKAPIEQKPNLEKPIAPVQSNESTVRLNPKIKPRTYETESRVAGGNSIIASEHKYKPDAQIGISSPTEAVLKQSENLRIAQVRISSLEDELEKLRQENSQLSSAGEILRRRADELLSQSESLENKIHESAVIFEEEKKVLKAQSQSKDKELESRRQKVEQLEQRLNSQFESIRRRERELEHRLEILKIENQDILSGKDKMILELKRQVDILNTEVNFSKERSQELYGQHKDKQETIRRVVKALRMALTILEGDEETKAPLKKVD